MTNQDDIIQPSPTGDVPERKRHRLRTAVIAAAVLILVVGLSGAWFALSGYSGNGQWVRIPQGTSADGLRATLVDSLGSNLGNRVYYLWRLTGSEAGKACGAYLFSDGESAARIARRLRTGAQTPVELRVPGVRTMGRLAEKIGSMMEITPEEFLAACDSILASRGYLPEQYPAAFLPDSYEMYWNTSAPRTVERLADYRDRFWTPERKAKAAELGLTETEVATVASIVEEESAKTDERPVIARLYLNRLARGMKLQADPTVKFSTGDFSLRRIVGSHLSTQSAYNTYLHEGLPPGPIRIVEKQTIDGVLNAPAHDYLYMCAKEDFSGYHNFASDYQTHQANARRYRAELDRRNIH